MSSKAKTRGDLEHRFEKAAKRYSEIRKKIAPYVRRRRRYEQVSTGDKWRSSEANSRELSLSLRPQANSKGA